MKQINTRLLFYNNAIGKTTNTECTELNCYSSISVVSNKEELTDTCSIIIPKDGFTYVGKSLNFIPKGSVDNIASSTGCNIGDIIRVYASLNDELYDGDLKQPVNKDRKDSLLFYGFVSDIKLISDNEYEIKCEDSMWLFKQKTKKLNLNNTKLKDFLTDLLSYYSIPDLNGTLDLLGQKAVPMFDFIPAVYEEINTFGKYITTQPEFGTSILDKLKDQTSNLVNFKFINVKDISGKSNVGYIPTLFAGRFEKYDQSQLSLLNILKSEVNQFDIKVEKKTYKYTDSFDKVSIEGKELYMPILDLDLEYVNINKQNDLIYVVISKQVSGSIVKYATYFNNDLGKLETKEVSKDEDLDKLYSTKKLSIKVTIPELSKELVKEYSIKGYNNYEDSGLRGSITVLGNSKVNLLDDIQVKLEGVKFDLNKEYLTETYAIEAIESSITENEGFISKITLGGKIK